MLLSSYRIVALRGQTWWRVAVRSVRTCACFLVGGGRIPPKYSLESQKWESVRVVFGHGGSQ